MIKYNAVIFDFDGTIADSAPGILNSVEYALHKYNIPVGDKSKLNFFIGPPLFVGFSKVYGIEGELNEKLTLAYRQRYVEKGIFESCLYEGMVNLLEDAKKKGIKLAVASSKPAYYLEMAMKHLKVYDYFDTVVGSEPDNRDSCKTRLVNAALKNMPEVKKDECIMVGDRFYDIEGAHGAGIKCIGVLFGYGGEEELSKAGADFLVKDINELRAAIL
jgi:phosphoglycolate phosphatase